jgi:FAD/FMN-containing dehydrogenase
LPAAAVCRYEVIDFVAVLFGYAISGERTLEAFYEHLQPWADAFMALFGRDRLPARSTLSRFLAALDQTAVESLRTLFLKDGLSRPLEKEEQPGGLFERQGNHYLVFDVGGTREAARQRALPQMADQPAPQRRLRPLCAPGYTGRKRGEVVRSRTTIWAAPTRISFWARLETRASASIELNYLWPSQPFKAISRRITIPKNGFCYASTGNMGREPSWPIWLGYRL